MSFTKVQCRVVTLEGMGVLYLLNSYVDQLQGKSCPRAADKQQLTRAITAAKRNDTAEYWKILVSHYEAVLKAMRGEIASNNRVHYDLSHRSP
jgi:hypothetical protein